MRKGRKIESGWLKGYEFISYLKEAQISQIEIQKESGVGGNTISMYINGRINPTVDTIDKLINAYNRLIGE